MGYSIYNHEHYCDVTARDAIMNIENEAKCKCVFICSPFASDVKNNTIKAQRYCKFAADYGYAPFAPHLIYPRFMDDNDIAQRETAMRYGIMFLKRCDELWVFGKLRSEGMKREIVAAKKYNVKIRYFTERCEEVTYGKNTIPR